LLSTFRKLTPRVIIIKTAAEKKPERERERERERESNHKLGFILVRIMHEQHMPEHKYLMPDLEKYSHKLCYVLAVHL
jgi:hypothetical protein